MVSVATPVVVVSNTTENSAELVVDSRVSPRKVAAFSRETVTPGGRATEAIGAANPMMTTTPAAGQGTKYSPVGGGGRAQMRGVVWQVSKGSGRSGEECKLE